MRFSKIWTDSNGTRQKFDRGMDKGHPHLALAGEICGTPVQQRHLRLSVADIECIHFQHAMCCWFLMEFPRTRLEHERYQNVVHIGDLARTLLMDTTISEGDIETGTACADLPPRSDCFRFVEFSVGNL